MEVKNFLNKHKVLISVILGLIVIFYLAFLFVVPNVINLNNYKEGTETVNVSVTLPDGATLVNDVRVRVKISKKK